MNVLKHLNAEFIECSDGIEAIKEYETQHPNYVLMDIELKTMDGLAATIAIRTKFPEAKIIMVTNYNDPQLIATAKDAGAIGYILKDNLQDLRTMIQ